jgi:hypothetical protein
MFLHAGIMHLVGNMLFLWIFGDNVEDKLGHIPYLIFYLVCGLAADFLHIATTGDGTIPTLGASGAISGVVGAYVVFFPRHRVKLFLWIFLYAEVFLVPAFWWIGFWFAEQLLFAFLMQGKPGGVAYWAHIGGFLAGVLPAALWKYVLFPRAFGVDSGARDLPSGFVGASRASAGTTTFRGPFVADPAVEIADTPEETYAVLRLGDDVATHASIAAVVSDETGEPPGVVSYRLRTTRGMITRNVDRATADRVVHALRALGVSAAIVPDTARTRPPPPVPLDAMTWSRDGMGLMLRGTVHQYRWDVPMLAIGANVGGQVVLDVFLGARFRARVTAATPLRYVDGSRQYAATLQNLAAALVQLRSGTALNEGVRVIAGGGLWGWLAFPSEAEYEDYLFWIYNLVLGRSHMPR